MSLIRIRRERQEAVDGPNRPPRLWKLLAGMILVFLLLYYLGRIS
jgi:hypothetical protein